MALVESEEIVKNDGPLPSELAATRDSTIPNAPAFVRSLNILLKFARLYGLEHARSAAQFTSTWDELREAVEAAGTTGLLLGASGRQLLLDGVPLQSTPAERSFADLLNAAGVASICFKATVDQGEFANLVRAFMETGTKAATLSERLDKYFGKQSSGIRVNEIRFVAEDAAFSEARVAAQLTAKTLGADADPAIQDWFRSPERMAIQLIAAAEWPPCRPWGLASCRRRPSRRLHAPSWASKERPRNQRRRRSRRTGRGRSLRNAAS